MYDHEAFYRALLHALGAPATDANLTALRAWQACEGSAAAFNPLDTTQPAAGATPYNTFGNDMHVWNYPDQATGVRATVETLRNGHYPHILAALMDGSGAIVTGAARTEMATWGTSSSCIAEHLGHEQPPAPAPKRPRTATVKLPGVVAGDKGAAVLAVQLLVGLAGGAADSHYGPMTTAAVKAFQRRHKLRVTGNVNGRTWRHLLGRR